MSEHHAAGPHRGRDRPLFHDPVAHRPGGLVAAAAHHGHAGFQSQQFRRLGRQLAADFFGFINRRQQRFLQLQLIEQRLGPARFFTSNNSVPEASLTSVANSPGQPKPHIIFGQQHLHGLFKVLRFVLSQPEDFRSGKSFQGGVGDQFDQMRPPADGGFDLPAFLRGALVVPQNRRADHLMLGVQKHAAVHLAAQADPGHFAGGDVPPFA